MAVYFEDKSVVREPKAAHVDDHDHRVDQKQGYEYMRIVVWGGTQGTGQWDPMPDGRVAALLLNEHSCTFPAGPGGKPIGAYRLLIGGSRGNLG